VKRVADIVWRKTEEIDEKVCVAINNCNCVCR